jgi:acylphosphatase
MNARAHAIIRGRVQGVFYRSFTNGVARSLGLSGWVRNMHDGSVEAVFEGEKKRIKDALKQLRQGPPYARVDDLEVEWQPFSGEFHGFSIRY